MAPKQTGLTDQNYFEHMYSRGESGPELVQDAQVLFVAANPDTKELAPTQQQYVNAVRFGHEILAGTVEVEDPLLVESASNVLGHIRLRDRISSGEQVWPIVGKEVRGDAEANVGNYQWAYDRNNAIKHAGNIWSGATEASLDPQEIHNARSVLGQALYEEMGPDLGSNLLAIAHASVLPAVALTVEVSDRLPAEIVEAVRTRGKGPYALSSQIIQGRRAIVDALANEQPTFPVDSERLSATMSKWAEDMSSLSDKVKYASKLYHLSSRDVPEWLSVAQSVVSGNKIESSLVDAYLLHESLREVATFNAETSGFKLFETVVTGTRIIEILDEVYAKKGGELPKTLKFAKAIQAGKTVAEIVPEINAEEGAIIRQAVQMIKTAGARIPAGASREDAVKLLLNTTPSQPINRQSKPVLPKTNPKPEPKAEPEKSVIEAVSDAQKVKVTESPGFGVNDLIHLPKNIGDALIELGRKQRRPISQILDSAFIAHANGQKINDKVKEALHILKNKKEP